MVTELVAELKSHVLHHSMPLKGGMPSQITGNNLVLIPATILRREFVRRNKDSYFLRWWEFISTITFCQGAPPDQPPSPSNPDSCSDPGPCSTHPWHLDLPVSLDLNHSAEVRFFWSHLLHFKAHNLSIYPGAEISIYVCSMNAHEHFSSWQVYFYSWQALYKNYQSLQWRVFDERNQWGCDNWIILWLCQMLCVGRDREGQKTREVECIFLPQSLRAICGTGEETHSLEPLQLSPLEAAVAAPQPPHTPPQVNSLARKFSTARLLSLCIPVIVSQCFTLVTEWKPNCLKENSKSPGYYGRKM